MRAKHQIGNFFVVGIVLIVVVEGTSPIKHAVKQPFLGGERMKKLLVLLAVAAALALPSMSRAACVRVGAIPRVLIQSAATAVDVRANSPGSTTFRFTTADDTLIHAAVVAELNHANVSVTGNAASCGAVVGGLSAGGTIQQMTVSP